jgi:hypothetical protein
MTLKSFFNSSKLIAIWLWRGLFHLLSIIAVIATTLYLCKIFTCFPDIVAIILSLAGLVIILMQQILDAREFADHKPNTVRNWIRSCPIRRNINISAGTWEYLIAMDKAHASVSIGQDASLENKVEFLLRQLSELNSTIAKIDDKVDQVSSSLKTTETHLEKAIGDLTLSIKSVIAGHVVGGYDLNLFGITITICGTLIQFFTV